MPWQARARVPIPTRRNGRATRAAGVTAGLAAKGRAQMLLLLQFLLPQLFPPTLHLAGAIANFSLNARLK
jgi:hypothetical protein